MSPTALPSPAEVMPPAPSFNLLAWLEQAHIKAFLPVPVIVLLAPIVWLFFRSTWLELDYEAQRERQKTLAAGKVDLRPALMFVIAGVVLTMQEYYGGRGTYDLYIRPWLAKQHALYPDLIQLPKYDELYGYAWWSSTRVVGYVFVPFAVYKLCFPKDSLLDLGLRLRGFRQHAWIYGLCFAVVIPSMLLVAKQPDFGTYYPFYKNSSRSWFDLIAWETMYFAQFFALELFFRGIWLGSMRKSLGSGAIFAMSVPYAMIHYGKPYLEAHGAIVAGIVLGSLSMKTRSIYLGFLLHVTVALSMDLLALWQRNALPAVFWPGG